MASHKAIDSLGSLSFKAMPKLELHAHLSGSVSPQCLHNIWAENIAAGIAEAEVLADPLTVIGEGAEEVFDLHTFFPLFSRYIYTLINSPASIIRSTTSVLQNFADDGVVYLELRTTPRSIPSANITKESYVELVLKCISEFNEQSPTMRTKLILSIDRRNSAEEAMQVVDLALKYRPRGVVGVDLCGNPSKDDVDVFSDAFKKVKESGLGITLHFGEVTPAATENELKTLLEFQPERIGHVIYVPDEIKKIIRERKLGLELCLSCNVLLKMMPSEASYADHHFEEWRGTGCPVVLCTDDVGVVGSPLSNEYALIAQHFNMRPKEVFSLARSGISTIFGGEAEKDRLRGLMW